MMKKGGSSDPPFRVLLPVGRAGAAWQDGGPGRTRSGLAVVTAQGASRNGLLRRLPVPGLAVEDDRLLALGFGQMPLGIAQA